MAKKNKKKFLSDDDLARKIGSLVNEAVGFSTDNIALKQEEAIKQYLRKPMAGDASIKGRSKYIVPKVLEHTEWMTGQIIRVFDTQKKVVEFLPSRPDQEALAEQQTDVANFVARDLNSHVAWLLPWVKNAAITGLGIVMVDFKAHKEELLPQLVKGVTDEQLVFFKEQEEAGKIIIEEASEPYSAPPAPADPNNPDPMAAFAHLMPQPQLYDLKIRHIRTQRRMNIVNLAPENFIVSKDADFDQQTGGIRAKLQGHKAVVGRQMLIEQGHDVEKIKGIPSASDETSGISVQRASVLNFDQGISDIEDEVFVYEIYTFMAIESEKRRHYRITLAGDIQSNPVVLGYEEVSKFYPYAAFCPFVTPNTLFGQGIADRVGPEQELLSKMQRGIIDNLNMHVHPIKVVNPDVTRFDDALNLAPGAAIRSTSPDAGINFISTPFTGASALPVMEQIRETAELTTGVGGAMMSINASDMQNTTATASSQRANASQMLVEMVCRHFADTGYRYLFRIIIDLLIQYPDDAEALITRLLGKYEKMLVDEWDPELDISATVAFGVMNKDGNMMSLQMILQNQFTAMERQMPFVNQQHIYETLVRIAENAGFKNANAFFQDPATIPPPPPPQPPQPSPDTLGLIEVEKAKAELRAQSEREKREFEAKKLIMENDRIRDLAFADLELKRAEIAAKYNAQVNMAAIKAEQEAKRMDMDFASAEQDAQVQMQVAREQNRQQQAQADQEAAAAMQQAMQGFTQSEGMPPEAEGLMPPQADMPPQF